MNLIDAMRALYAQEINSSCVSFFDNGWTVQLGDNANGFTWCITVEDPNDAVKPMIRAAIDCFPNSRAALENILRRI